eukprot:g3963.t1
MDAHIVGRKDLGSHRVYQIEVKSRTTGKTFVTEQRYTAFADLKESVPDTGVSFPKKVMSPSNKQLDDRQRKLEDFLQSVMTSFATMSGSQKMRVAEFIGSNGENEPTAEEAEAAAVKAQSALRAKKARDSVQALRDDAARVEAEAAAERAAAAGADDEEAEQSAYLDRFHTLLQNGTEVWKKPRKGKVHKRVLFLDGGMLKMGKNRSSASKAFPLTEITGFDSDAVGGDCWLVVKHPDRELSIGFDSAKSREAMRLSLDRLLTAYRSGELPREAPAAPDAPDAEADGAVDIPEDLSLPAFVLSKMRAAGGGFAMVDGQTGHKVSYSALEDSIKKVASALHKRGLKKGDVFAIFMPNCPDYAIAFHAVAAAGGVVTTINPAYKAEEVAHQLKDAGATWLLAVDDNLTLAKEAIAASGQPMTDVIVSSKYATAGETTMFQALLDDDGTDWAEVEAIPFAPKTDLVALPYSSGTTGLPKGVMLTHYNVVANLCQCAHPSLVKLTTSDTLIGVLPFFHIYGMVIILNLALTSVATVVTMPRFDPQAFLKLLQEHKVTVAHLVPPLVLFLAKSPVVDAYDLSALKEILCGAAPLGEELTRAVSQRLQLERVRQGYGMTELSPASHISPFVGAVPGAIGKLVPNMRLKIVDTESGDQLGVGQDGEVCVSGPNVMAGYLNNAEATAHTIRDGFLHTGDVGHVDENGHYFIVDRVKELIKYKGFQVAPAELEGLLQGHEAVADAAVVPKADVEAGELPVAFVVLKKGKEGEVSEEDIKAFVKGKVASYKQLREVRFTDEIPKSASGKILRRVLKDKLRSGDD